MNPASRRETAFPSWAGFEKASARAFESRLRLGALGFDLPPELKAARLAPYLARPGLPRRVFRAIFLGVILVHLAWILSTSLLILAYRFVDPSATVLMAYRKWDDGWKLERPRDLSLRQVPAYLRSMLVAIEDDKFYEHHGIDPAAFKRAYEINQRLSKPLYGGSTLTMQVARTLFLVPVKSYVRKYAEVIVALELELFLPKARILELYFGYAEWGKGLFGIEAAARHYYGVGVQKISREEGARLIALLSSPIRFNPDTIGKSAIVRERFAYLVHRYVNPEPPTASAGAGDPLASPLVLPVAKPPATPEPGGEAAVAADGGPEASEEESRAAMIAQ